MFLDENRGPFICREIIRHFNSGEREVLLKTDGDLVPDNSRGLFYFELGRDAAVLSRCLEEDFDLVLILSAGEMTFGNEQSESIAREVLQGKNEPKQADEYSARAQKILRSQQSVLYVPNDPLEKVALTTKLFMAASQSRALIVEDADNLFSTQENNKQLLDNLRAWQTLADEAENVLIVLITRSITLLHSFLVADTRLPVVTKPPATRDNYLEFLETAKVLRPAAFNGIPMLELAVTAENYGAPYKVLWQLILWCEAEGAKLSPQLLKQRAKRKKDKSETMVMEKPEMSFADVAGLEQVKTEVKRKVILPMTAPDKARRYGVPKGGSILLWGAPGVGKTLIARAIAGELKAPFFKVTAADILSKWYGESLQRITELFRMIRQAAQQSGLSVCFFDEVDSLLHDRDSSTHEVTQRVVNQFLTEMDGFDSDNESVLRILATNKPWLLDGAAMRSPRVDVSIYVPLPDEPARKQIWSLNLEHRAHGKLDFDLLATSTEGFTGADIAGLCKRVAEKVFEDSLSTPCEERSIEMADIMPVLKNATPSVSKEISAQYEHYARER